MVVIVGGGCSGVLVAAHFVERCPDAEVAIVEPLAELGRGIAYATTWDEHLLNVPAGQMSAFDARPAHFADWLTRRGWPIESERAFAPRRLYGEYLADTLRQASGENDHGGRVTHVRREVVDLDVSTTGLTLTLNDRSTLQAASAVLALGNASPASAAMGRTADAGGRLFGSAWDPDALRLRSLDERVLLIGSGLTAIDAVLALEAQGHIGPIHLVSRRGRLPQAHERASPAMQPAAVAAPMPPRAACRATREEIDNSGDWRGVIDGLRLVTNDVWRAWSVSDRTRFLRHLKVYWDGHRHRMAPDVGATLDRCLRSGRLQVHAARIGRLSPTASGVEVAMVRRGGSAMAIDVDRVISCTGIAERYESSPRPLIRTLLSKGLACANVMGTGFSADPDGALVDRSGRVSSRLFTVGPPRYGDLLETIAVPDIRTQADRLAARLAAIHTTTHSA